MVSGPSSGLRMAKGPPLPFPTSFRIAIHEIVALYTGNMEVEYPMSKNPGAKTAARKKPANQFEASRHFLFFFFVWVGGEE